MKIDFLGIGAHKSGTTWLARRMTEHPDLFIPADQKIHYFNKYTGLPPKEKNPRYDNSVDWYESLFSQAEPHQRIGEFSPIYLWDEHSAGRIHSLYPQVKLIAILRNPVERVFSDYLHMKQIGVIPNKDFLTTINERPDFLERGLYFQQLFRYYNLFSKEQIKILFFETLQKDPAGLLSEVANFLGISPFAHEIELEPENASKDLYLKGLNWFLLGLKRAIKKTGVNYTYISEAARKIGLDSPINSLMRKNLKEYKTLPETSAETKQKIRSYYRDDIESLERLIDQDLSMWK